MINLLIADVEWAATIVLLPMKAPSSSLSAATGGRPVVSK